MNIDETQFLHEVVLYFPVFTGKYQQFLKNYHRKYNHFLLSANPEYQYLNQRML